MDNKPTFIEILVIILILLIAIGSPILQLWFFHWDWRCLTGLCRILK